MRTRLTQVAGWQAFYLGLTSFDLGDDRTARKMLRLAQRHASEATDLLPLRSGHRSDVLLLQGSIAAIQSSVAYFTGAYGEAADMQDHVWDGPLLPGPNPGNAAFAHTFLAISLAHTGRGDQAEGHARTGLALEQASGPDHFVQIAGKYNALAHLRRPHPEPEEPSRRYSTP
ncbi:hypothetical protein [Candidatus Frankia nodulisporulans]|uniref:hypothetical protein n=1 Tax=Candidatus Frankia nodulisporulans TaxID=2060052 RepID=UPI0013D380F0|nr:hypothetical protein [Candidatus Frankia nodulisporulans]